MRIINLIAWIIAIVGGLNWLLIGIFDWNLVSALFGTMFVTNIIYILVGLSVLWLIIAPILESGRISLWDN